MPVYPSPKVMLRFLALLFLPVGAAALSSAEPDLTLPGSTQIILDHIYSGRSDLAIPEARELQQQSPGLPLGYILEAEALWWNIWCSSAEFKYGMTMPRHREKRLSDQHYLELAAKAMSLAESSLKQHESADMYFYAGMAEALEARFYGLRWENRATARMGVHARENFTRALALDPGLADADMGLGLYDYYVDTLSTMARVLRFFMGIPGGSKENGIRLLQIAIHNGQLTPAISRFYLAINLHNYDQRYEEALQVLTPLVQQYPGNPIFLLSQGDLYAKLGRKSQALATYQAAAVSATTCDPTWRKKIELLAQDSIASVSSSPSTHN
jgi:tetratricopeptide (TPR) repeat protein